MPYQTIREPKGIYQKFWGDVVSPELYEAINVIQDDRDFNTLRYVIKDYLDVELFDVGVKTLLEGLALHTIGKRTNPDIVVAIVATNPEVIDASNAAQAYHFDTYPREVFSTLAEARTWIDRAQSD